MLMRVTSEGIHSSINIRYFELNDIPYIALMVIIKVTIYWGIFFFCKMVITYPFLG